MMKKNVLHRNSSMTIGKESFALKKTPAYNADFGVNKTFYFFFLIKSSAWFTNPPS